MDPIQEHFDHLKSLVELEEQEEISQFKATFLELTPEEREKIGKALLRLQCVERHYSPGGHRLVTFEYADGKPLPIYSPDTGDPVTLSLSGEFETRPLSGTVYEKDRKQIIVAFRDEGEEFEEAIDDKALYDLNASGSRATFRKMYDALRRVKEAKHQRTAFFRDVSLGLKSPESYDPLRASDIAFINDQLNVWQKEAVLKALAARDIFLVHGPPGTGKTTVLVEIIRQTIQQGKFVFATAPSNTACDQLLECLIQAGVPALRLGHPARIMNHLRDHTLDHRLAQHPMAQTVEELEAELERLYLKRERRKERRTLTYEERAELRDRIRQLKHEIREMDQLIYDQVSQSVSVVVGTHTSGEDPFLKSKPFDLLVMDEASQAIEPLAWVPLLKAQKVILAGDHFQLPPTVRSKDAEEKGLGRTLFERFHGLVGDEWKSLLRVQYRMNEKIMNFSSGQFYASQLIADESVKHQTLSGLSHVTRDPETDEVFLFLDTAGRGFEEKNEPGSQSRYNEEEAESLVRQVKKLLALGVRPREIAVISPYSAQVRLLSSRMPDPEIEVDSVDGFQGREKEAVLVSLVRSNMEGDRGFLNDTRRMNVAMTRAKRKLWMIGDSATLGSLPFYQALIQYTEKIHAYRSSWEEA